MLSQPFGGERRPDDCRVVHGAAVHDTLVVNRLHPAASIATRSSPQHGATRH